MAKRFTRDEWILQFKSTHGNLYDYSLYDSPNATKRGIHTKEIRIVCRNHGLFIQQKSKHRNGQGCPKCGNIKRGLAKSNNSVLDTDKFIKDSNKLHNNKYDYGSLGHINPSKLISVTCKWHGKFRVKAKDHLLGQGCKSCSDVVKLDKQLNDFIVLSTKLHSSKYKYHLITNYRSNYIQVDILCTYHGSFSQTPYNHLLGQGCPKCGTISANIKKYDKTIIDTSEFIALSHEIHDHKYDYPILGKVYNNHEVTIICPDHGAFSQCTASHLSGHGCNKCAANKRGQKRRLSRDDFISRSKKVHGDKYDYINIPEFVTEDKVPITCKTHGIYYQNYYKHLIGQGCPSCACSGISKAEKDLVDFIKSFYPDSLLENDRNLIYPKELDIVLPKLKIAIEFNGIYWHSVRGNKHDHSDKTIACNKIGYRLIHIYEDDWYYKQDIIKNYLKYQLGYDDRLKVSARKCTIRNIDTTEAKAFLSQYHIQGSVRIACSRIGLIHNDTIVAVLICKRDKTDLNIARYATSCNVRGGFSRLLKYIINNHSPRSIVTFADKICSSGDLYEHTGFKVDYEIKPDYKYVINGHREHKFRWRHTSGLPTLATYNKDLTEFQNMDIAGIPRIYDCGKIKYRMDIDQLLRFNSKSRIK